MGGEELELLCAAAAGARYSEPIKLEGLNQTDLREKFTRTSVMNLPMLGCGLESRKPWGLFEDDAAEAIVMRESISARIIRQSG